MDGILTGMYAGKLSAWHRLGIVDPTLETFSDAVKAGKMDYDIHKLPLTATMDGVSIPFDMFGLVRGHTAYESTYQTLGTCGADYDYFQNREAADRLDLLLEETGWKFATVGILDKGATIFLCASLKGYSVKGDEFERFFSYIDTRNGKSSAYALLSDVRIVCKNTQNLAMKRASGKIAINHRAAYKSDADWILAMVTDAEKAGNNLESAMNALAEVQIDTEHMREMTDTILPAPTMPRLLSMPKVPEERRKAVEYIYEQKLATVERTRNAIMTNYESAHDIPAVLRGTGQHAFQAVTEYITHQHGTLGTRGRKMSDSSRAQYDLFSDDAQNMRNAAFEFIMSTK